MDFHYCFILIYWSLSTIQFDELAASGLTIAKNIILGIFQPDLIYSLILQKGVAYLLIETMAIAFLGTIIGAILAIPLAFLSASNIVPKPLAFITFIN